MTGKRWTFLAYLAGEPDLAEAMVISLKEMCRAGAASGCTVSVQFNPTDAPPTRFTMRDGAIVRAESPVTKSLEQDGRLRLLGEVVPVERLLRADLTHLHRPRADTNRAVLESFIESGITDNPSDHYLLVLSGHASGVVGRTSEQDGFSPGAVRTRDLGPMFERIRDRTGRVIDVLGMDACFMSMCEVCWELRRAARFLVASEGLTPQYGWPYHRFLELLRDDGDLDPRDVASGIVGRYLRYRSDFDLAGQSVDLSACELSRTELLTSAFERLCREMAARLEHPLLRDALVLAHWKAQSYKSEQYVDLWDLCHLLGEHCDDEVVRSACRRVQDAVSSPVSGIVAKSIYNGPAFQHSHGLSVYFPWSSVSPKYGQFGFAKTTGWNRFLAKYVSATRREMRGVRPRASVG